MKTLIGLASGGAVVAVWKVLPAYVKVPAIAGAALLAAAELNTDLNQSWFSSQIFAGQGAEGAAKAADPVATLKAIDAGKAVTGSAATLAAQYSGLRAEAAQKEAAADAAIADPVATRKAIDAGKPVSGAVANAAAQYQALKADAKQKEVYADAAEESEDELLAKKAKGKKLTSTEQMRLFELQEQRYKVEALREGYELQDSINYGHGKPISSSEYLDRAIEAENRYLDRQ